LLRGEILLGLVQEGHLLQDRATEEIRQNAQEKTSGHSRPLPLSHPYQCSGGDQQQDQGHKESGLWV
ncbi:hypothetical protein HKBW3S25_00609, partial [Candidatus Hakubella thermalkaliphila]